MNAALHKMQNFCYSLLSKLKHAPYMAYPIILAVVEMVLWPEIDFFYSELVGFELSPSSSILKTREHMFQKLDLLPSSGEGGNANSVGSLRKS